MPTYRLENELPGVARRVLSALIALVGTIAWTHALAGVLRGAAGIGAEQIAPAGVALTLGAVAIALAGAIGATSLKRALIFSAITAVAATSVIALLHGGAMIPALSLLPAGTLFTALGFTLARRLPSSVYSLQRRRPVLTAAWVLVALLAVIQIGRLATWVTNPESDWFLSTRHPFFAKHECANAYVYGAELAMRGERNVYDPSHYPGLNPEATPETQMAGMSPEDPYQYAPQFLLWPRLGIALTSDYTVLRSLWFGLNVTLCIGAVVLLASWVGGPAGMAAVLLAPVVLVSFPALHNFQYGQFHFAAIALAVLAMLAFQRNRSMLGGGLLAVSILSKLFPALLLLPLAVQRRWKDLAWTAAAGAVITAVAFAVLGADPFVAFFEYHLPRLSDGSAFAFGEAWPEVATLVAAGNQGIAGIVNKLDAMGLPIAGSFARVANLLFGAVLLVIAVVLGIRMKDSGRAERAVAWVSLLGLASLSSTGAWADYVPLTCVWLLTLVAPLVYRRPLALVALSVCAVMQMFLIGAVPIGEWSGPGWMMPLSLFGALAMLVSFGAAALAVASRRIATSAAA